MNLYGRRITLTVNLYVLLLIISSAISVCASLTQLPLHDDHVGSQSLSISHQWQSLGPFQIGTREAIWGADPLEAYGGFINLPYEQNATFRSSLTTNATVQWTVHDVQVKSSSSGFTTAQISLHYPDVDWDFLQKVYGWSALQFQAWTRGEIYNHASYIQRALIFPDGVLEFRLNELHVFGGDFYTFSRAPVVVDLLPGKNFIQIRLIQDVRAMGGHNPPVIEVQLRVQLIKENVRIDESNIVAPDLVDDMLPSRHMSIPILNTYHEWVCLIACDDELSKQDTQIMAKAPLCVAPGQSRPIAMEVKEGFTGHIVRSTICYTFRESSNQRLIYAVPFSYLLTRRGSDEAHKFTFLHPSGTVSYAIIKTPQVSSPGSRVPLLVGLHGAGLEADSHQVRHVLDEITDLQAFSLFPTGMSPWSGDDWHIWGMADVLAAIDAVHDWVQTMKWNGTKVITERLFMSGHSNGGQGTWFFASHMPDRTLAAVPASGYTSIENYVPFNMWRAADPLQSSILHAARFSFRHELLVENLLHIPLLQQHGSADDNVPPYHSRLMSNLRAELGANSDYLEIAGREHWWDGAMTTRPLREFYQQHLSSPEERSDSPSYFALVSPATDEMGSKFGMKVEQLLSPDRLARVEVRTISQGRTTGWQVSTSNVLALSFNFTATQIVPPEFILLDDSEQPIVVEELQASDYLTRISHSEWTRDDIHGPTRIGAARGALDAIMRTKDTFSIVSCGEDLTVAVQIARNMFQYFGADSTILPCDQYEEAILGAGNVMFVKSGPDGPSTTSTSDSPFTFSGKSVTLSSTHSGEHVIPYQEGLGAVFLRPLLNQRLELVVWGYDTEGLQQAARLVPTLTGGGQPDFVFLARKAKWLGHGGALALGFLDHHWRISGGSHLP